MTFVPSRDLVQLHSRSKNNIIATIVAIEKGLGDLARALGALEDEEEHVYISKEGSRVQRPKEARDYPKEVDGDDDDHRDSREDAFELAFAKEWLMSVSCLRWLSISRGESDDEQEVKERDGHQDAIDEILRQAARLLAICAGKSASGKSKRVYHFECGEDGHEEISVPLQEQVLVNDALGSRTWGSAPLLASHLLQSQLAGHLSEREPNEEIRILELGSGTGLVGLAISLYIKKLLKDTRAQIYLTDYHLDVLANLKRNVELNRSNNACGNGVQMRVAPLNWSDSRSDEVNGRFDLIVAADCIYEAEHANLIKTMAERYLQLPKQDPSQSRPPELILCCPLRPTHQQEIQSLEDTFNKRKSDALRLQIIHQQDLIGWDDFGPPTLRLGSSSQSLNGRQTSGQKTHFRLYMIQWC